MNNGGKYSRFFKRNVATGIDTESMRERVILMDELKRKTPAVERKMDVDLEDALDMAGAGRYQLIHSALMLAILVAAMLEMIGIAFVLPAAACDLDLPDSMRGIITSIPNIGVILTAPFWGRAADHLGRKPVLLFSTTLAGVLGLTASMMPNLVSFGLCKLATSLFLSCPSSLTFAYQCEMLPRRRRDRAVLVINGLMMLLSTLNPVFGWAVLSTDWRQSLGSLVLRPWRLLTAVYAAPLLLSALWLTTAEESPKFLMTKGRDQEALEVLKRVYEVNTGMQGDTFGVKSLKSLPEKVREPERDGSGCQLAPEEVNESVWALLRPPHLKWLALTGFLMLGLFSLLNGLFLLAPDTINKVMNEGTGEEGTICTLINQPADSNATSTDCVDSMSHNTFYIMIVTTLVYGVIVTGASMSPLSKKTLLVTMYSVVGAACLTAGLTTNRVLAGTAMSALQLTAMGIGPLTAYAVHLFPTSLRGTAVGAVMMFGRVGSASGANAAGYFLAEACTPTFYGFTALTFWNRYVFKYTRKRHSTTRRVVVFLAVEFFGNKPKLTEGLTDKVLKQVNTDLNSPSEVNLLQ